MRRADSRARPLRPVPSLFQFTSFRTRYYRSDTGKQSSEWLLAKIQEYTNAAPKHIRSQITVAPFEHTWAQTSIIVRIEPTSDKAKKEPIAIVSGQSLRIVCVHHPGF